jgi:single-strand DNA-binding protein
MLNKAIIIGRLGKDPEIRNLSNESQVANFSVATSESYKNKSGEKVENTEWHNVVIWNPHLIRVVENYISKGTLVYIEGKLKTRKWDDKNGTTHYNTEIVIENFGGEIKILSPKNEHEGNGEVRFPKPGGREEDGISSNIPETELPDDEDNDLPF